MADALDDDERALAVYQNYNWRVVAHFDHAGWELSDTEVRRIVGEIEAQREEC